MIDPISIVGLTIAIFDQLLKLGERSAELTSDIRGFSDDMKHLHGKIKYEDTRTRALRSLLFEPCVVYGGRTLFEQFEEDVQEQIKSFLGQLVGILSQAHHLLAHRYGSVSSVSDSSEPISSTASSSSLSNTSRTSTLTELSPSNAVPTRSISLRKSTRSPFLIMRWSFYDKKQAEKTIREFGDLNSRILDHIKLVCLGSTIGVDLTHLTHLKENENSKRLGFDIDATLKLTVGESQGQAESLEVTNPRWIERLRHTKQIEGEFAILDCHGVYMLQEARSYVPLPQAPHEVDLRTHDRIDALARLLQQPKEQVFRIPRCIGWKFVPLQNHIAFLFEVPQGVKPQPVSLLKLLEDPEMKVSLGGKFHLACGLAKCIAQLHMVRWVHESFRSENILFYPSLGSTQPHPTAPHGRDIDFSEPWILGFEYSRPELDFSSGSVDFNANRDVYRHPERQGQPRKMFNKTHDIYALAVVLLEIGLWEPAITLEKNKFQYAKDPESVKARLVQQAERRLESKVGAKYRDVVLKCLDGNFGVKDETKEDLKLQQAFRSDVVDILERAAQNV